MSRNAYISWFLIILLGALSGCSSEPSGDRSKKAATTLHQIHGKAQVLPEVTANDAALNAGGPSVFLWDGVRRYRLFLKTPISVVAGKEYLAEGIHAQKVIDELGDPDQGKNGYPLAASCQRVVRMAWTGLSFDAFDSHTSVLRAMVKRYPARPVFLVTRLAPIEPKEGGDAAKGANDADEPDIPVVSVAAEKQRALLIDGPAVQPAPLWDPAGGTACCKVIVNTDGKISELETGAQLCEAVPWDQFRYQPPVKNGNPVKVKTEVEVRFEARR
jgi:hypothetical protein